MPAGIDDLQDRPCLIVRENGNATDNALSKRFDLWTLHRDGDKTPIRVRVRGPLSSNSGELVRDWCLQGRGIMLRSWWDVAPQLASGQLVRVMQNYSMPDADIHWLAPYRPGTPRRIRLLIDFLVDQFQNEPWKRA